jgi:5-methylcytosine-specific restriction endonuclease McrA
MKWNEDSALRSAWRRIFTRSPLAIEVLKEGKRYVKKFNKDGAEAKKESVEYLCNVCKNWVKASVGGKNNIAVDHVIPVISIEDIGGKIHDWNLFKAKLFCPKSNLQIICKPCHLIKTDLERKQRNALKDRILLDKLEEELKGTWTVGGEKDLKKRVNKFLSKTKAESTRERAMKLKQIIINKLKED